MTKTCQHCGKATGYRRIVISIAVLPGEEGEAEEKAIKSLSTRKRAEAILAKSPLTAGEGEK